MANMWKATVRVAYGTGGMRGPNGESHQYWSGKGVAFGCSPKVAIKGALKLADHRAGEGVNWTPVLRIVEVEDAVNGRLCCDID